MTVNNDLLAEVMSLPDVLGVFIRQSSGSVMASQMPQHFAQGQVEKTAIDLSQKDSSTLEQVGTIQRRKFAYYDFTFYVYSFAKGELFVLCRPKVDVTHLDQKIEPLQQKITLLLKKGPGGKRTGGTVKADNSGNNNEGGRNPFLLLVIACLTLIILGGGIFIYLQKTPPVATVVAENLAAGSKAEVPPTEVVIPQVKPPVEPVEATVAKPEIEVVLRLEGSFTLGNQLTPQIAMDFMREEMFAGNVRVINRVLPEYQQVVGTLGDGRQVAIEIVSSTSGNAFSCLQSGRCDIGMSSRPINPLEMNALERIGPMTNSASEHILALDGIAVILHPVNNIDNLDLQQIADIFSGKITSWSQVPQSGLDGPIHVYGRDPDAGSSYVFRYLALSDQPFATGMTTVSGDGALADHVAGDKNAIGFVSLPYMKNAKAIAINQDGAAPVFPTPFTISTEDYPLSRRLYLYTAVNPKNYLTRPFFQYALGETGQKITQNEGFVSLTIDKISQPIPADAPPKYRQSIVNADRLSLNFRFRSGSSELDNRGKRDLERLINFLIKPENRGKSIRLLGFADTRGERAANCYLSKVRAEKVATILQWRGITTEAIEGFCDDMPIATNTTALGRERNRRVEVWLGS